MIQIKVYLSEAAFKEDKVVFERILSVDGNIPFDSVCFVLRILFGSNSVITLNSLRP